MKTTGNNIFILIISLAVIVSVVSGESEYCAPPPTGMTVTYEHIGTWYNFTITNPDCYSCVDNGAGYGDVDCTPCMLPSSKFISNVTCGNIPFGVQFTDYSTVSNITNYTWDFSDGGTSVVANPTHEYTSVGVYSVNHGVIDGNGTYYWSNLSGYITARPIGDQCAYGTTGGSSDNGMGIGAVFGLIGGLIGAVLIANRIRNKGDEE